MKNLFHSLLREIDREEPLVLATLIDTKGSVPQIPGASAVFSSGGLLHGTLGGGVLEGDATSKASKVIESGSPLVYSFDLNAEISVEDAAICGGTALIMMEPMKGDTTDIFKELEHSLSQGTEGILTSFIRGSYNTSIERFWVGENDLKGTEEGENSLPEKLSGFSEQLVHCLKKSKCQYLEIKENEAVFFEPVRPLSSLIIGGAGHIGKALAHMANLLDFEVTLIDDRPEYANRQNVPDADHIIVAPIGKAFGNISMNGDTYIVIVTRGHKDDADALRSCIGSDVPYIGMIGSRKKIRLMREKFISENWSTPEQFARVQAPVGIEIGSKTVQEIALSISAQLVQTRNQKHISQKAQAVAGIILAAGESRRMGEPKMLLPFGDVSMVEKVVMNALGGGLEKTVVVLGAGHESVGNKVDGFPVETVHNKSYKSGMLSSVQRGIQALTGTPDAAMILLGDQPMIGPEVVQRIIEAYLVTEKEIVVAAYRGKRGHPLIFGSRYFQEVIDMSHENSLRNLLELYPHDILEVDTENPEILRDIDTKNDYHEELKYSEK